MDIRDNFITKILELLPKEGIVELNALIDSDEISEEKLSGLLKKYNIDAKDVMKEIIKEN